MAAQNYTRNMASRLLDEHDAQAAESTIERRIREAQARHPRARVYFDHEINDVVVDVSSGGR